MTMNNPIYDIDVQLSGENGNVFNLMAIVTVALKSHGATPEEISEFRAECTSGDYNHALRTMSKWVHVQ